MPERSFDAGQDPMLAPLGAAGVMLELIRHADRVRIGCMTMGLAAAAFNKENGELTVFVINRDWEETADFTLELTGLKDYRFESHPEMFTDDKTKSDTWETPDAILPKKNEKTVCDGTEVQAVLQPLSWNVFRFVKE